MLSNGAKKYLQGTYTISKKTIHDTLFFRRKYYCSKFKFYVRLHSISNDIVNWGDVVLNSLELLTLEKDLLAVETYLLKQGRYQLRCFKDLRHFLWTMEHIRAFHELNKFSSIQDKRIEHIRLLKYRVMEACRFIARLEHPKNINLLNEELDQAVSFW